MILLRIYHEHTDELLFEYLNARFKIDHINKRVKVFDDCMAYNYTDIECERTDDYAEVRVRRAPDIDVGGQDD